MYSWVALRMGMIMDGNWDTEGELCSGVWEMV